MITTIRTYRNLRSRGLSRAWEISGMPDVGDKLVGILCWIVGIVGIVFLLSDYANAAQTSRDSERTAYVQALEKLAAACLSDATGRPVKVGDDWFLCSIYPLGSFK